MNLSWYYVGRECQVNIWQEAQKPEAGTQHYFITSLKCWHEWEPSTGAEEAGTQWLEMIVCLIACTTAGSDMKGVTRKDRRKTRCFCLLLVTLSFWAIIILSCCFVSKQFFWAIFVFLSMYFYSWFMISKPPLLSLQSGWDSAFK